MPLLINRGLSSTTQRGLITGGLLSNIVILPRGEICSVNLTIPTLAVSVVVPTLSFSVVGGDPVVSVVVESLAVAAAIPVLSVFVVRCSDDLN